MSRAPQTFTQSDVTKACKGAVRAGLEIHRVEIMQDKIVVFVARASDDPKTAESANEWDRVE
jgi:hypothetical protein